LIDSKGELVPKFRAIVVEWFERFSTDGIMVPD
jgi:hypothetical protein